MHIHRKWLELVNNWILHQDNMSPLVLQNSWKNTISKLWNILHTVWILPHVTSCSSLFWRKKSRDHLETTTNAQHWPYGLSVMAAGQCQVSSETIYNQGWYMDTLVCLFRLFLSVDFLGKNHIEPSFSGVAAVGEVGTFYAWLI